MRQAIATTFHGPTNTRGTRVRAKADAGAVWHNWDYALGIGGNHMAAARKLAEKLGWKGEWHGGALPGHGYAFVCIDRGLDASFTVEAGR